VPAMLSSSSSRRALSHSINAERAQQASKTESNGERVAVRRPKLRNFLHLFERFCEIWPLERGKFEKGKKFSASFVCFYRHGRHRRVRVAVVIAGHFAVVYPFVDGAPAPAAAAVAR
jgi:hypothetical protein